MGEPKSGQTMLPQYLLEDIINRLEDARYIAEVQLVGKEFRDAGNRVRSVRFIVRDLYHERARNIDMGSLRPGIPGKSEGGESSSRDLQYGRLPRSFKDHLTRFLEKKGCLVQLRIEVEGKLQAKIVPEDEKRRTDFWISDPYFLKKWLPSMNMTLEHLCIVDYGQQAIMRRSTIIKILSENCKLLKTLDLRNMFIDTSDCVEMPSMITLTWRCVKVTAGALEDINKIMPRLQTLALLGVFGVERGNLTFIDMKVLCLGLSTPAKDIVMNLPKLEKLQLKMKCPKNLIIHASILKYVAFNLEVPELSIMELICSEPGLQELLYGASSFITLSNIVDKNPNLKKIFLDIPCMALGEDGRFLGVLKDVALMLPSFSKLCKCEALEVLNIGPGLWYCMETNVEKLANEQWPSMRRLILHMIPQNLDPAIRVLQMLLRPSVSFLTIYVHTSSSVKLDRIQPVFEQILSGHTQDVKADFSTWTKSLDFSCFSF